MKNKRVLFLVVAIIVTVVAFSGCASTRNEWLNIKSSVSGLPMTVKTYDENSNVIDYLQGKSISIEADEKFGTTNEEGEITSKSSVLNITIGGKQMYHVGSSLIAYDSALVDYIEEFPETLEINSENRNLPFLSRIYNKIQSSVTGKKMIILIRSQNGTPLATFIGDSITINSTDIDKSTSIYIDGKRLFVYRCDYTMYETSLLDLE